MSDPCYTNIHATVWAAAMGVCKDQTPGNWDNTGHETQFDDCQPHCGRHPGGDGVAIGIVDDRATGRDHSCRSCNNCNSRSIPHDFKTQTCQSGEGGESGESEKSGEGGEGEKNGQGKSTGAKASPKGKSCTSR